MPLTPEQHAARAAQREATETRRLQALGAAASHLASLRKMNLGPTNQNLLWANWEYLKAQKELDGDGYYDDAFGDACHDLGVDAEGEDLPRDPADYGDYLYDQRRDRMLDAQIDRERGA